MELVSQLVDQLGIHEEQAAGAVGAVLTVAVVPLEERELIALAEAIPGFSDLLGKSPTFDPHTPPWRAKLSRWFGGLGVLRPVTGVFRQLGLPENAVREVVAVVQQYLKSESAEGAQLVLEKALN